MNKLFLFIITLFLVFGSLIAEDKESVALTIKIKGDIILTRDNNESKVSQGEPLYDLDVLKSKEDSYAAIKFIDGNSLVKLFPNSILEIKAEKKEQGLNKKSILKMGELWAKVTGQIGSFELETPTTVVSVKGTKFLLSVEESGHTTLYAFSGIVEIANKLDDNRSEVNPGEMAVSSGEGEILVQTYELDQLDEEIQEYLEETSETMMIELENEEGEVKKIRIELE